MSLKNIKKELRKRAKKKKAALLQSFFKTAHGEYGEGDVFIGVMVPYIRKTAKEYNDLPLRETLKLLRSPVHEERLTALLILVEQFRKGEEDAKEKICRSYLKNHQFINSWDLVDLTAPQIVGGYLYGKDKKILYELARSGSLWKKRIAIIATFYDIRKNKFKDTLNIADILLGDKEDLIHKAVGWMLREVGKRDKGLLVPFLNKRHKIMPRTMLRYAIEKFPEKERQAYLKK